MTQLNTAPTKSWDVVGHATPEQVKFYRDQGYLKFGRIFEEQEIQALRDHVDAMIANLPAGKRPEEMDRPHFTDPWLFRYMMHPRVLDVIQDFIGPDIALWSSHFIAKPQGDGKAVPWHTDGAYWRNRLKPMNVITLWLAVDPSTLENGCMRVIPGTHREIAARLDQYEAVDSNTNVFNISIPPEMIDEDRIVNLELQMGECHFHDSWTVHGSNPNFSDKRRCGYTMRYMPASVEYHPDPNWPHQIYLVRGRDRTNGHNEYTPIPAF
jgi:chlorinating enzyme